MSEKNRVLAIMLAAAVLLAMLSSSCCIAIEANHDCVGEDCRICHYINACEYMLKSVGQAAPVGFFVLFTCIFAAVLPAFFSRQAAHDSLVSLKVKLSN